MTQGQLAELLHLSQSQISHIERGERSLSAEELLVLLGHFNVGLDGFSPPTDHLGSLQNALARFGAYHLREDPRVHVVSQHSTPRDTVRSVLLQPSSERLVTALAPVLVVSIEELPLTALQHELSAAGVPHRLPWLVDNLIAAIAERHTAPRRDWALRLNRTSVVLAAFKVPRPPASEHEFMDAFDPSVRSTKSYELLWEEASSISHAWRIATRLQPQDFSDALEQAIESR